MESKQDDHGISRRYLLGELSEEIQLAFEERLLTDDEAFEELLVNEDEIIEQYLDGELTANQVKFFESKFLNTPERQEKLQFANTLKRYIKEQEPVAKAAANSRTLGSGTGQSWMLRIAAVVVVTGLLAAVIFYLRSPSGPASFATLTLTISSSSRAEGPQVGNVKLDPSHKALRIDLQLPPDRGLAHRYRVELLEPGATPRDVHVVGFDSDSILVEIPSSQLQRREYALQVAAIDAQGQERRILGNYYFNVS